MSRLDELLAKLSGVILELDQLPAGDERRAELEARRDELRDRLRSIDMDAQRPTSELLEEHTRLQARLKSAGKDRVKKVTTKYLGATQTVGGGVEPSEINRMLDERNRVEELTARLERLTAILEARGAL